MKRFLVLTALLSVLFIQAQNEEIDRLTVELTYQNPDSVKVDKSLQLITKLIDANDYAKAFLYVNQTLDLAKSLNYSKGLAEANYYKAMIYGSRNDYFNAVDNYNKSLKLFYQIEDSLGLAKVSSKIGLLEIERGNYQKGMNFALSAINTFEKYNLKSELSDTYKYLADAHLNTNNINASLEFSEKALSLMKSLDDSSGIKSTTIKIAQLYAKRKENRKAIDFYNEALNVLNPKIDVALYGEVLSTLGNEYLIFKDYNNATKYLLQALRFNRIQSNSKGLSIALNGLGNLNYQNGKLKTAEAQLLEAYDIANTNQLIPELLNNYKLRIQLDSARGYFQNAFKWQSAYYQLKSTTEQENLSPLDFEDVAYSAYPLNKESSKVTREQTKAKQTNTVNTYVFYSVVTLAVVLLAGLVFTLLHYRSLGNSALKGKKEISSLKDKNQILQSNNKALEDSNQVKDKLFSIVSHDLKDSISSIKAFLDLLREDSITKEEFNELIPELSENANNASALLFNLLNWSKSQLQNLDPNPELVNIQEIFRDKIDLVEQKVEEKNIIIIDESERDFVYVDKSMIEIVIQNLITNAVKFSRRGDMITVSNTTRNGMALICVEDSGVGIPEENISKLFNAANNFTTRGTKNEKGTGLGLSIAKDLIKLNRGEIWVESTVNVGSKFFIELPKKAPK